MDIFQKWRFLQGQSIIYLVYALLFALLALWSSFLDYFPTPIRVLAGLTGLSFAVRFFILAGKVSNSILHGMSQSHELNKRIIDISSGTYNESINVQGDYVQGDKYVNVFKNFNFNQDPIDAIEEIQKIVNDLSQTTGSSNFMRQKVTDDLIR